MRIRRDRSTVAGTEPSQRRLSPRDWRTIIVLLVAAFVVILNETVLVCQFNGYPAQNAIAVGVFEQALPFHDIVPIDCSGIITLSGAIHCIVKHVPEMVLFRDTFDGHSY